MLDPKDIENIEKAIARNGDDIAVSIARSFERLEEHIDEAEKRIYERLRNIQSDVETIKSRT